MGEIRIEFAKSRLRDLLDLPLGMTIRDVYVNNDPGHVSFAVDDPERPVSEAIPIIRVPATLRSVGSHDRIVAHISRELAAHDAPIDEHPDEVRTGQTQALLGGASRADTERYVAEHERLQTYERNQQIAALLEQARVPAELRGGALILATNLLPRYGGYDIAQATAHAIREMSEASLTTGRMPATAAQGPDDLYRADVERAQRQRLTAMLTAAGVPDFALTSILERALQFAQTNTNERAVTLAITAERDHQRAQQQLVATQAAMSRQRAQMGLPPDLVARVDESSEEMDYDAEVREAVTNYPGPRPVRRPHRDHVAPEVIDVTPQRVSHPFGDFRRFELVPEEITDAAVPEPDEPFTTPQVPWEDLPVNRPMPPPPSVPETINGVPGNDIAADWQRYAAPPRTTTPEELQAMYPGLTPLPIPGVHNRFRDLLQDAGVAGGPPPGTGGTSTLPGMQPLGRTVTEHDVTAEMLTNARNTFNVNTDPLPLARRLYENTHAPNGDRIARMADTPFDLAAIMVAEAMVAAETRRQAEALAAQMADRTSRGLTDTPRDGAFPMLRPEQPRAQFSRYDPPIYDVWPQPRLREALTGIFSVEEVLAAHRGVVFLNAVRQWTIISLLDETSELPDFEVLNRVVIDERARAASIRCRWCNSQVAWDGAALHCTNCGGPH